MAFPSLLSDHEQRAFSEFLNQLAQEDTSNHPKADGLNGPGGVDPSLTQQQQQQLQLQLQHHLHLRQLQQQQQQQQHSQNGFAGVPRLPPPPMMPTGMSLDSTTQQLALAQQQRDLIQQISSNPLLAPGGIINPHAMSQAMLQNPLLMAQANAISQAMVLAQQQQQQQLQLQQLQQQQQQQQQHQQQFQQHQQQQQHHLQQQQQPQLDSNHHHSTLQPINPYQQQQPNSMPPPFHQQQHQQQQLQQSQYPSQQQQQQQQQQQPSHQEPLSPNSDSGASKPAMKRKSKTEIPPIPNGLDNAAGASPSRSSSPTPSRNSINPQKSPSDVAATNGNSAPVPKVESDVENGPPAPPTKKAARRKGSSSRSFSIDATNSNSSLVVKPPHRNSRDGFDPLQGSPRRKAKGESNSKNGMSPSSQQQNGNSNRNDISTNGQEKSEETGSTGLNSKLERASPSPSTQQQQHESTRSPTPSQSSPSTSQSRPNKKPHHELLTDAEKKANHIASEQKRRQNIRVGFDSLVEIVPTLSDCHRSEAVILQKSVDYIHRLLNQKNELKSRVRELQIHLGDPLDDIESASDMEVEQDD
ncbi:hypothetical protein BGX21_010907 [Mortierella sp. AD011]|nr:hypothetical protein BGX21_010907 [Mortierella sp. AD011]